MARLILMCGLPGSGKSTYASTHVEEDSQIWVSMDNIREQLVPPNANLFSKETLVFNTFINQIRAGLNDDYDVYADSTNYSRALRQKLLSRIPHDEYDEIDVIWIKVDVSTALAQNEQRKNTRRYIQPHAIKALDRNFSEPEYSEGFDNIYIVEHNGETRRKDEF